MSPWSCSKRPALRVSALDFMHILALEQMSVACPRPRGMLGGPLLIGSDLESQDSHSFRVDMQGHAPSQILPMKPPGFTHATGAHCCCC
ncbi:hypothetical protein NDU88_003574 [Pleurodeles waltl]|uniref:Uncharacterized protein n=1 Tax=Pleurodeles waltl TaxID=8319 RepID=A0AAV7PCM6_PLEWA|nr:hypothetical protein NDU88_003574 [Pleurodeles waltl]